MKDTIILEHIDKTLAEMLTLMKKPENKFVRAADFASTIITILGVLTIAELIVKWIRGG